ncbi:MAG TPA: protein usg [Caulobacteraceae bacterium]|nr:protein usg [Caulobacteraceae bacterium]
MRDHGVDSGFHHQLQGKRLTTAEVLYYMPAHPSLLQSFLWQTLDEAPDFPRIHRFLDYWRREIDAVIHSVSVAGVELIAPPKLTLARFDGRLH